MKLLSVGARGPLVSALQAKLNDLSLLRAESLVYPALLKTDGIFGVKTLAGVKDFQIQNDLVPDGIVGPLTWAKLRGGPSRTAPGSSHYCNCANAGTVESRLKPLIHSYLSENYSSFQEGLYGNFTKIKSLTSFTTASSTSPDFLLGLRRLTSAEQSTIDAVYGSSIDYVRVLLSKFTGMDDRAFVLAFQYPPQVGLWWQVVNIGESFSNHTLIHEMGHVWQSQHDPVRGDAYIANALASQAAAGAANIAFSSTTHSAYAYRPGKLFASYGAEQLAQQAANGEPDIVAHVRALPKQFPDPNLAIAMSIPRFEDTAAPGVKI